MRLFVIIILFNFLFGNKKSINDTLFLTSNKNIYLLSENFIFPKSLIIESSIDQIIPDSIDYAKGYLFWKNNHDKPLKIIVKYNYLEKDLPINVGPFWSSLSYLDSLDLNKKNKKDFYRKTFNDNLFTSGSIDRKINFSSNGTSDLTGGLNLSLSGKLDNGILLGAILSDRNMVIPPQGNTRNLEDFDQVYISMSNPYFSLNAGDILYSNKVDALINLERNVIGLNANLKFDKFNTNALVSSTRGQYIKVNINGIDGAQGPYELLSSTNSKNIYIIAGSEKVWLDGQNMERGANYDYVIDYSLAEITFTAKQLITVDSDILVEYEFVDDNYTKGIVASSYKMNLSKNLNVVAGFHREKDNTNDLSMNNEIYQNTLNDGGDAAIIPGAIEDSLGSYYLDNEVFIFDPFFLVNDVSRYSVVFTNNENGNYERLINLSGRIYYRFVHPEQKEPLKDYFSPNQLISAPKSKNLYFSKINYDFGNNFSIKSVISRSSNDRNILSNSDNILSGNLFELDASMDSLEIGNLSYGLSYTSLVRQKKYTSFSLDRDVQFKRDWDIDNLENFEENKKSLDIYIDIKDYSNSDIQISSLDIGQTTKNRLSLSHTILNGALKGSGFNYKEIINSKEKNETSNIALKYNIGYLNPYLIYRSEKKTYFRNYEALIAGLKYQKNKKTLNISLENKNDSFNSSLPDDNSLLRSNDVVSSIKYINQKQNGWRKNIVLKKRLKDVNNTKLNYLLGSVKLNYFKSNQPINYELKTSTEQTQNNTYTLIYDSVGVGLGNYRYDKFFNTYIQDPNGPFISYPISTGNRTVTKNIKGLQILTLNFRKFKNEVPLKINFNTNFNYSGSIINLKNILNPNPYNQNISKSYINNMIEIELDLKNNNRRLRGYNISSKDFQGYDARGNELLSINKSGIYGHFNVTNNSSFNVDSYYHRKKVQTNFSDMKNREFEGVWHKFSYSLNKFKVENKISLQYGLDRGVVYLNNFKAYGVGFEYNGRLYLWESGSVLTNIGLNLNEKKSDFTYIPPEALNGQTLGKNTSASIRLNYFLKQDISLSISFNYLNNKRYNNLLNIIGEFRAYL